MSFIAGSYTATYDPGGSGSAPSAADIGRTREGFTERKVHHHQPIQTDAGGEAEVDGVQLGADYLVTLDWVDYDLIEPVINSAVPEGLVYPNVGKLHTNIAGPLVLTPVAGTTAASNGGVRTYHKAVPVDDLSILFSSRLRQGPLTFRCYPDPDNGNKVFTQA